MELIELQCNSLLKTKFENVDMKTFHQYVGPTLTTMSMLTSDDVGKQLFSLNINKSDLN